MDKIVQWNCRSAINKKHDLIYIINKYDPFVIALSETWLKPEFCFKISKYSCIREDRRDGYGGVAILIKNSLPYSILTLPSHSDDFSIVAISVKNICYVSIYVPHPSSNILNEISNVFSFLPRPFLVLGDFNSHHQSWGCSTTNCYGVKLLEIIDTHNLCILNSGVPTRRTLPNEGLSAVDLSISTPNLASSVSWYPLSSTFGSDHFPLIIQLPFNNNETYIKRKTFRKYRLTDANWEPYKKKIEHKIPSLPKICKGEEVKCAAALTRTIQEVADKTFPLKNSWSGKIPSPPWWDKECTEAIRKRKEMEKNYNKNMTTENFQILSDTILSTRKFLKKKKLQGWRNFCTSVSPDTPSSVVWSNIKRFRSAFNSSSSSALSPSLADQFLDRLAPSHVPQENLLYSLPLLINDEPGLNSPFTLQELKGVLSNTKDSSPGEDEIPYAFISKLGDDALLYYLDLINCIMLTGNIPPSWKSQTIIPILKPNKNPSDACSYRPIALSPTLLKIAEHLIKNRLEWFIESKGLLANSQFGFRKGRGTMDSISILTTDIRLSFSRNEFLLSAFLDIEAAYDNVNLFTLKNKLEELNIPIMLSNFIFNILYERSISLTLGDSTKLSRLLWKGLPQGSVLSPLLYNIYTYDLESSLNNTVRVLQYADDLLLYSSNHSIEKACTSLSLGLELLKSWLDTNSLQLSTSKSTVILFTKMRTPPQFNVLYDNTPIPIKDQVKFLGVILDSKLTGVPHCDYVAAKCERNLNILRCLSGVWWGAHPFSLKLLYNALIRSILDYGTFLLEPGNSTAFKKLDVIQSKALRLTTGAMKSSPVNALQVECGDPPLHLRRQYLSDRYIFSALQFSNHPLFSHLHLLNEYFSSSNCPPNKLPCLIKSCQKLETIEAPTHRSPLFPVFDSNYEPLTLCPDVRYDFKTLKTEYDVNTNFNYVVDRDWQEWHHIFTDASKHSTHSCVGIGVYHSQYDIVEKIKLPPQSSVFTGECFGLYKAVEYILLMKLQKSVIFSDSMSALQALEKFPFKCKPVYPIIIEIRNMLHKCSINGYSVVFEWLPSHSGIVGNEKADRIANEAVWCGDVFPFKNYCHDLIALSKLHLQDSWNEVWKVTSLTKGKFYSKIQPEIPSKPWFFKMKFDKTVTSILIRMRLGHVCTPVHLARLHIVVNNLCDCGTDVGDLNHIFLSCPLNDNSSFYAKLISLRVPCPIYIPSLLASNNYNIYKAMASFITSNNIKL